MDAVSFHGAARNLHLKFSSKTYKRIETTIRSEFLMESPSKDNLHVFASFSGTDLAIPTVKVRYCGNDHRSWIDIIVLYKEMSIHDEYYFHQSFSETTALSTTINTTPDVKDQVLVFSVGDSHSRNREKNLYFLIHGKSYQIFELTSRSAPINLMLSWVVQFQPIPSALESLLSLQGESYQLKTNLYCNVNKGCPEVKIHWIPNQLSNYRDQSYNRPHECLTKHQINMDDKLCCLNFSSDSTKHNYIYITIMEVMKNPHKLFNTNGNESQVSWNDASFLCQHMGGSLPIIRSKSELDEFIALVTFSQYIPPQEKVFIGLSTKIKSKVKISSYIQQ